MQIFMWKNACLCKFEFAKNYRGGGECAILRTQASECSRVDSLTIALMS